MFIAIVRTLLDRQIVSYEIIAAGMVLVSLIGVVLTLKIKMNAMPPPCRCGAY